MGRLLFGYCAAACALLGRPGPRRRTGGEGGGVNCFSAETGVDLPLTDKELFAEASTR